MVGLCRASGCEDTTAKGGIVVVEWNSFNWFLNYLPLRPGLRNPKGVCFAFLILSSPLVCAY